MKLPVLYVKADVRPQLVDTCFHDPDILGDLSHEDRPFQPGHKEVGRGFGAQIRSETPIRLPLAERFAQMLTPAGENLSQALAESLVEIGELRSQVPHGASPNAVPPALSFKDAVQKTMNPLQGGQVPVAESGLNHPGHEPLGNLIEDRVTQILLAFEVVVKIPFSDAAFTEDIVKGGVVIPLDRYQAAGCVEDLLFSGRNCCSHCSVPTGRYRTYFGKIPSVNSKVSSPLSLGYCWP